MIASLRPYLATIRLGLMGSALLVVWGIGFYAGHRWQADEVQDAKAAHAADLRKLADLAVIAADKARNVERAQTAAFAAIGADHEREKDEAFNRGKAAAAAVRTGAIELRDHWTCPAAGLPGPGSAAGKRDEGAELRATDSGDLVQAGADCDAQLRAAQEVIRGYLR